MKKSTRTDLLIMAGVLALVVVLVCVPFPAHGEDIQIHSGLDTYERPIPVTIEDGQQLSAGLADTLNAVIAAWEAENAGAASKVEAIIEGNREVIASAKRANEALGGVPGGVLAKTLAMGIYGAANPLGTLGGRYGAGGASITWNAFNLFELTGRAGLAWSPQFHPEVSLAAEWWLF